MGFNSLLYKDESVFTRATEFIPERWGKEKPFGDVHPFVLMPFSHGKRICIGKRVAEQEAMVLVIKVRVIKVRVIKVRVIKVRVRAHAVLARQANLHRQAGGGAGGDGPRHQSKSN